MPELASPVEIPKRALFKAAEVCDLAKVQPYVLRSWEAEFPELGIAKTAGAPRVYRRTDVEQVLRIKHLLLVDGLTLAGARRRLEEETAPVAPDAPVIDELIGQNARERRRRVPARGADGVPHAVARTIDHRAARRHGVARESGAHDREGARRRSQVVSRTSLVERDVAQPG